MALGQRAGCPRVSRAKKFMCSPRNTGNIKFSLWLTGGLSQGCPDFQKVYVFKVYVPFSCPRGLGPTGANWAKKGAFGAFSLNWSQKALTGPWKGPKRQPPEPISPRFFLQTWKSSPLVNPLHALSCNPIPGGGFMLGCLPNPSPTPPQPFPNPSPTPLQALSNPSLSNSPEAKL